jgi:threonine synthase
MGLPIDRLVIATNVNDILARTIATGTYDLRDVIATSSPECSSECIQECIHPGAQGSFTPEDPLPF